MYRVETTEGYERELRKLDGYTRTVIQAWISENLEGCEDPRARGKPLTRNFKGRWRYRIGDYRLICEIQDNRLVILTLHIGHRRYIYKR